jgi:hypothetical protein
MRRLLVLLALLIFLWMAGPAPEAQAYPSNLVWRTIETENFRISYHQGLEQMAHRLARMAESVHAQLVPLLDYEPGMKTELLLVDHVDTPNGFVNVYPYNRMVLYAVPPERTSVLNDYDDWLRVLFVHEHTHTIQLDTKSGLPAVINKVFGGMMHPNQYMPRWYTEGMAVSNESEFTAAGRLRSSLFEMFMRMDVYEDQIPTIDQINGGNSRWPYGHIPYLYGGRFMQYLSEKYGNETFAALGYLYGQRMIPLALSTVLKKVTDDDFVRLYDEWTTQLRARYAEDAARIAARGLTELTYVTETGETHDSPVMFPSGDKLLFFNDDGRPFRSGWAVQNLSGGEPEIVLEADADGGATIAPDGRRIVVGELSYTRNEYFYYDLYLHDLKRKQTVRLTEGERAREPSFAPDGRRIAYVRYTPGHSQLMILDTDTGETLAPLPPETFDQVFSPVFSPDGRRIAFTAWRTDSFKDLWLLDLDRNRLLRLTNDRNLDQDPAFSADGRTIYWSSDRSSVYNIYAINLDTLEERQVTNVIGGAFNPMPTPDGTRLYLSSYRSHGFDLAYMDLQRAPDYAAARIPEMRPIKRYDYPEVPYEDREYSPFPSLYPKIWMPTWGEDYAGMTLGVRTWGDDISGQHSFTAEFDMGVESASPTLALSYSNRSFTPNIGVRATHVSYKLIDAVQVDGVTEDQDESRTDGSLSISLPFRARHAVGKTSRVMSHTLSSSVYFRYTRLLNRYPYEPASVPPTYADTGMGSGLSLTWSYQDRASYPAYIATASGRSLFVSVRADTEILGSDVNNLTVTGGYAEYVGLPWWKGQGLAFKLTGGFGLSGYRNRQLFFLGGPPDRDIVSDLIRQNRSYGDYLRGYKPLSVGGDRYVMFKSEYRAVLWTIDRGIYTLPLFFRRVHLAPFFDMGLAWTDEVDLDKLKKSVGAEIRLDVIAGYFTPITIALGYQLGLDDGGVSALFFTLDNVF